MSEAEYDDAPTTLTVRAAFFKVVVASAVKFMPRSSTAFLFARG